VSPKWGLPLWVIRSGSRRQRVTPERDPTQAAIPTIPGARAVAAAPRANSDPRGTPARAMAVGHLRRLRAGLGNRGQQGAGSAGRLLRQPEVHRKRCRGVVTGSLLRLLLCSANLQRLPYRPIRREVADASGSTSSLRVGALASLVLVGWLLHKPYPRHIESLAVLPLHNLSGDPAEEYFADGMTDELIADLGRL